MLLPVAFPINLGDDGSFDQSKKTSMYRVRGWGLLFLSGIAESVVLVSLLWTVTEGLDDGESWIMGMAVAASVGALCRWCLIFVIIEVLTNRVQILEKERSDVSSLIKKRKWNEAAEQILFKMGDIGSASNALYVECQRIRFQTAKSL